MTRFTGLRTFKRQPGLPRLLLALLLLGSIVLPVASRAATAQQTQADWILSLQTTSGADLGLIPLNEPRDRCIPYFSNIAASGLAAAAFTTGDARYSAAAWRWLSWYGAHMDATGFVTDYQWADPNPNDADTTKAWVSTGGYDSTDSYAATFLVALRDTFNASTDTAKLQQLWPAARKAMTAIQATADADHLTYAKPTFKLKYLMDNAEVYEGWRAVRDLATILGDSVQQTLAQQWLDAMPGSLASFWNESRAGYDIAISDTGVHVALDWSELYPSTTAQAWMIGTGLVAPARATALVEHIDTAHPSWDDPSATDLFQVTSNAASWQQVKWWPEIAAAFEIAGNPDRSAAGLSRMLSAAASTSYAWPYHVASAGKIVSLTAPAPSTSLTSVPTPLTNATTATFGFAGSSGTTFECSLDGAVFVACTSPSTTTVLAAGPHRFAVRARDVVGRLDPTPAQWSWRVDTAAPATSIGSHPADPANATRAVFAFSGSDDVSPAAALVFRCSVDGGVITSCVSPWTAPPLQTGSHTASILAVDEAGNVGDPATFSWFADTSPPKTTIRTDVPRVVSASSVTIAFDATDDVTASPSFTCRINGATPSPCTSPLTVPTTLEGIYVVSVAARDGVGNTEPVPQIRSWLVDRTPPGTAIVAGPPGFTQKRTGTIYFSGFDSVSRSSVTFRCSLDRAAFAPCTSPATVGGLADGVHSFEVSAIDEAGLVDPTPARADWTIDAVAPTTTVTTPDGALLANLPPLMSRTVNGTARDDRAGIDRVEVTFTPASTAMKSTAMLATITCDASRRDCTWAASPPEQSGNYTVTALSIDRAGNSEPAGTATIHVLAL